MASIKEKIKKEIEDLIEQAREIEKEEIEDYDNKKKDKLSACQLTLFKYQLWYSKTLILIKQVMPERLNEFIRIYEKDTKRKDITVENYSISDFLHGISISHSYSKEPLFNHFLVFVTKFRYQFAILLAAQDKLDSILSDIKGVIQAEMFDSELEAAKELLSKGFLRSAGVLAGVTLERHLANMVNLNQISISKKDPTLSDYNDTIKNKGVYDVPKWRFIQRLTDIRNLCSHSKDREPEKEEVSELIYGVDKVIKTFF